ncbi:MAG: Hpt domain-containing protein [Spirochaetes bacterium]|nr:Hpt domain-containing protein [Spirochaetota bacterium]
MTEGSVINRGELKNRLEGDIKLFRDLSKIFMDDHHALLDLLRRSISDGDCPKLVKAAHTLKGAVSNFSAERACNAARMLEEIGRSNSLDLADEAFAVLENEICSLLDEIRALGEKDSL